MELFSTSMYGLAKPPYEMELYSSIADDAVSYIVRGREVGGRVFNPPDNPLITQDFI